jgi:hypothetical protein
MTIQEAYEAQKAWFSREGAVYGYEFYGGRCVYRGNNDPNSDCRCAVGCLMPNEAYDPKFDKSGGVVIESVLEYHNHENPALKKWAEGINAELLGYLRGAQAIHDSCAENDEPISDFLDKLDRFYADTIAGVFTE